MHRPSVQFICTSRLVPAGQWRWDEGRAQVLSTFRTAAELLRQNPKLTFTQGPAAHHALVERLDPPLFREIQGLAAEGRWCFSGGWYLEPSVRGSALEPLVRNLILARRYFADRFKARPRVACALDTVGAPAGLPQILRRLGYELLVSLGPSSSGAQDAVRFVRWIGACDSEVLGLVLAPHLARTDSKGLLERFEAGLEASGRLGLPVPVLWGLCDHEGGGAQDDLRLIERFIAQEKKAELRHGTLESLHDALREASGNATVCQDDRVTPPPSDGGLPGVLSRRSARSLACLRQAEALLTAAWALRDAQYPDEDLGCAWRAFLDVECARAQTLTRPAEEDALAACGGVEHTARRLRLEAAASLQRGAAWKTPLGVAVLNSSPGLTRVPIEAECMLDFRTREGGEWHVRVYAPDGAEVPCQEELPESLDSPGGPRRKVVFSADLPGVGAAYFKVEACPGSRRLWPAPAALSHAIDPTRGLLTSVRAGDGLECLAGALLEPAVLDGSGAVAGRFKLVEGPRVLVKGPIRSVTESVLGFGSSRITARIVAYAGWPVLEVRAFVEWSERDGRLAFLASIPFAGAATASELSGAAAALPADGVDRPCGRWIVWKGTPGGQAAALGVACSVPHTVALNAGAVRWTVLADLGVHELGFAVTAGEPGPVCAVLPALADWLDEPPAVLAHLPIRLLPNQGAVELLNLEPRAVRLEACKRSWDGKALVVRLTESLGEPCEAVLRLRSPDLEKRVSLRAFEIKTLRIEKGGDCRDVDWAEEA